MWHLVRKEFSEHGWLLFIAIPLSLFGFLIVLAGAQVNEAGSPLEAVRFFGLSLFLALELLLCNRLVVQEYSGKTQLFLEALPISRATMLLTKYMLGIVIATATLTATLMFALVVGMRGETYDARFIALVTTRLTVFVFCTYSFFFMMGLLGRYRISIYVLLALFWIFLSQTTEFDTGNHGPFGLLNDKFAYERTIYPTTNLIVCVAAGIAFFAVSMLMGITREGSIAGLLAERMSYREKLFMAIVLISMFFAGSILNEKKRPQPYSIENGISRVTGRVAVHVENASETEKGASLANQLADQLHDELVAIEEFLDVRNPSKLFVVQRSDLDADRFESAWLENASGTLVRVNYLSSKWNYQEFQPFIIDKWLSESTNYNANFEPQCWVLEGFSDYWPRRMHANASTEFDPKLQVDLRAAYAGSIAFEGSDVNSWYRYRERVGEPIARAVACAGLVLAEREYGAEKVREFLQVMLGREQPGDVRADFRRWLRPISVVWKETMGSDYEVFQSQWASELRNLSESFKEELSKCPILKAECEFSAKSSWSRELLISPICDPLPQTNSITIRYNELTAFDVWEHDYESETQIETYNAGLVIRVHRLFSRGERIRWTTSTRVPELGCDVISGWQRVEVE